MMRRGMGLAILGAILCQVAGAGDWPQWRGPDRDGRAQEPGLELDWRKSPPQHEWTMEGLGNGYASCSIQDGMAYTTGNFPDGQAVVCIDLSQQKVLWKTPLTEKPPEHSYPGARCTPTIDGDRLYVVTSDGQIACLKRDGGQIVWRHNFSEWGGQLMSKWGFSESPLVDGDRVLCTPGGPGAMMVCLDKTSGKEIWRVGVPYQGEKGKDGAGYSSIVISNAAGIKQYVQLVGHGIIGVDAEDGKLLWGYDKIANDVANIPTPICTGDFVFASTGYQTGACLIKITGSRSQLKTEEVYFVDPKQFQNHHGGMVLDGEFVYAGTKHGQGFPTCLHLPTGRIRWGGDFRPPGSGSAGVLEVNDQLIFRYEDGTVALMAANPRKYQFQGSFQPDYQEGKSWAHPVVVDGKLYLREQDKLMCYQL